MPSRLRSFVPRSGAQPDPAAEPKPAAQIVPIRNSEPAAPLPAQPAAEVLSGLREDWLSRETTAAPASDEPADSRPKPPSKPRAAIADYAPFLESLKDSVRRRLARHTNVRGKEARSAATVTLAMFGGLAVLIFIGAILYAVSVSSIFAPGRLSASAEPNSPVPEVNVANIPDGGQATQRSALPAMTPGLAPPTLPPGQNADTGTTSTASNAWSMPHLDVPDLNTPDSGPLAKSVAGAATGQPFSAATSTAASRVHDEQAQTPAQTPTQRNSASPAAAPPPAPSPTSTGNARTPAIERSATPEDSRALNLLRAAQASLARHDVAGATQSAAQAKALDPHSLPALELLQQLLAASGNPRDAEAAAHDAIAHGGKAVFELQHVHASPAALHPARIVITATTLEFVPEAPCTTGAFTLPLSAITTVQIRQNTAGPANLAVLNIRFNTHAAGGELSFRDASSQLRNANPAQLTSQLSAAQESALFTAIRNVLLAPKGSL